MTPTEKETRRKTLPYGMWICRSGRQVLFNRKYKPIWQRECAGALATACNSDEFVEGIVCECWFFDDHNDPLRPGGDVASIEGVLTEFLAGEDIATRATRTRRIEDVAE